MTSSSSKFREISISITVLFMDQLRGFFMSKKAIQPFRIWEKNKINHFAIANIHKKELFYFRDCILRYKSRKDIAVYTKKNAPFPSRQFWPILIFLKYFSPDSVTIFFYLFNLESKLSSIFCENIVLLS